MISQLFVKGGDERLLLNESGVNQYFVPPGHKNNYIIRSSSTCNMISSDAFNSLKNNYGDFVEEDDFQKHSALTEEIKKEILDCLGIRRDDVYINLTSSGTDSEILLTCLSCLKGKLLHSTQNILNFIPTGTEVGRGMGLASDLRYFSNIAPSGLPVKKGEPILGTEEFNIQNITIPFRNNCGTISNYKEIERLITTATEQFLSSQQGIVVLRVVSYSKTGLQMPQFGFAKTLKDRYPGRVVVEVNSIQMRCNWSEVKKCLDAGMAVSLSGSKFFGGPPFSGVLLLPKSEFSFFENFDLSLPRGFRDLFSSNFLDSTLFGKLDSHFLDFGLLFRWKAALHEMKRYASLKEYQKNEIISSWCNGVNRLPMETVEFLQPKENHFNGTAGAEKTILPFHLYRSNGKMFSNDELRNVYKLMSMDLSRFFANSEAQVAAIPILIGQPVKLCDEKSVLRISLSAPQIVDINQQGVESELSKDRIVLKKLALISNYYDQLMSN